MSELKECTDYVEVKQLTIEELREQFEEYYRKLNPEMEDSELKWNKLYIYCRVQELWIYFLECARANNIIKEEEKCL